MRHFGFILFLSVPLFFSGCLYYPDTIHQIEADSIQQPFANIWIVSEPGIFTVIVGDTKRDLSTLKATTASFTNQAGLPIPIEKLVSNESSKYRAVMKFYHKASAYTEGAPFAISIAVTVAGENLTVAGKFSTRSHTKIVSLQDELDHG